MISKNLGCSGIDFEAKLPLRPENGADKSLLAPPAALCTEVIRHTPTWKRDEEEVGEQDFPFSGNGLVDSLSLGL